MQTSPQPADSSRTWLGQKAKRTQAIPKHTLQGAELEIFKPNERNELNDIDYKKHQAQIEDIRRQKQERYTRKLPDYLKKKQLDDKVQQEKGRLVKQMKKTVHAQQTLDSLETHSKYFNVGLHGDPKTEDAEKHTGWFTKSDLQHAEEINILGLKDSSRDNPMNYNRDKYRQDVQTHQYSRIGNPLKTGMDFVEQTRDVPKKTSYLRRRNPDWLDPDAYKKSEVIDTTLAIDIPANIKHKFGTKICHSLLCDKDVVDSMLKKQQDRINSSNKRRLRVIPSQLELPDIDPVYSDLSQAVRQNVFPGHSYNHLKSWNNTVHTQDVFDRRLKDPEQYRYSKDELSIWNEHKVLRDRMTQLWSQYNDNKPTLTANWDRNAKREPKPPPVATEQKPKPKPRNKPPPKTKPANSDFPDVVFVTPPRTPPPPPAEQIHPKKDFQRDDAFWELYDG